MYSGTDAFPGFFQRGVAQVLWTDTVHRFSLTLGLNTLCPEEGLWRVSLLDQHGQPVYGTCFSILPGPRLFIGVIQGGRASAGHDPRAAIRAATRHFAGLRPQFLLLQVLRELAMAWDIPALTGVADAHQVSRRRRRHLPIQVRFSYDAYFAEAAAQPGRDGNWALAAKAGDRAMHTLPSRKRALYRRREQLLQDLANQIRAATTSRAQASPGAPASSAG